MQHLTLNTGHLSQSPRSDVSDGVIATLKPLVPKGGTIPSFAPFHVNTTHGPGAAIFSVYRGKEPIVICGLAYATEGQAAIWDELEHLYMDLSDQFPNLMAASAAPAMPAQLPWLAVLLLPTIGNQPQNAFDWLADFERCYAWAIIEHHP